jgi:hypothetical protein
MLELRPEIEGLEDFWESKHEKGEPLAPLFVFRWLGTSAPNVCLVVPQSFLRTLLYLGR